MNSLRFRPDLVDLETRDTPASPLQVIGAFQATNEVSGTLRYLGANMAEGRTTAEKDFIARYATSLTIVSRANAQYLAEFKADLQTQLAANPAAGTTITPLLEKTARVQLEAAGDALLARVIALGFGASPSVVDPPPPTVPGTPSPPPPTTPLNPTDASGMTDTFPGADSPNYVDLGTGVKKWDVVEGVGTPVAAGGSVKVFYTLWLASTGQQVETNRNGTPLSSALSGLIVGWQEGVPGMKPGGIRRLVIPPEKGYGSGGTSTIPPNATLVFEIKLLTP